MYMLNMKMINQLLLEKLLIREPCNWVTEITLNYIKCRMKIRLDERKKPIFWPCCFLFPKVRLRRISLKIPALTET